jgi:hypothetical protein
MHPLIDAPLPGATLFRSRAGGFPLLLCTYTLLDVKGNATADVDRLVLIRVTALNGGSQDEAKPLRFRLRDPEEIRRFLAAVGQLADEVTP